MFRKIPICSMKICRNEETVTTIPPPFPIQVGEAQLRLSCYQKLKSHLSADGEGEVSCAAAVHGHVGLLHSTALHTDLKRAAVQWSLAPQAHSGFLGRGTCGQF